MSSVLLQYQLLFSFPSFQIGIIFRHIFGGRIPVSACYNLIAIYVSAIVTAIVLHWNLCVGFIIQEGERWLSVRLILWFGHGTHCLGPLRLPFHCKMLWECFDKLWELLLKFVVLHVIHPCIVSMERPSVTNPLNWVLLLFAFGLFWFQTFVDFFFLRLFFGPPLPNFLVAAPSALSGNLFCLHMTVSEALRFASMVPLLID